MSTKTKKMAKSLEPERSKKTKKDSNDISKIYFCGKCNRGFSCQGDVNKHQNNNVCSKHSGRTPDPFIPSLVTDNDINIKIVSKIDDPFLRFSCAQRLGAYTKGVYPLCFVDESNDNNACGITRFLFSKTKLARLLFCTA